MLNHLMFVTDPRVKDWPMMSSPVPTMALCVFYAYFSKSLAPKLMSNRRPMDLRQILVIYNLFQTIFSAWIFYEVSRLFFFLSILLFELLRTIILIVKGYHSTYMYTISSSTYEIDVKNSDLIR